MRLRQSEVCVLEAPGSGNRFEDGGDETRRVAEHWQCVRCKIVQSAGSPGESAGCQAGSGRMCVTLDLSRRSTA